MAITDNFSQCVTQSGISCFGECKHMWICPHQMLPWITYAKWYWYIIFKDCCLTCLFKMLLEHQLSSSWCSYWRTWWSWWYWWLWFWWLRRRWLGTWMVSTWGCSYFFVVMPEDCLHTRISRTDWWDRSSRVLVEAWEGFE